jgi:hypothetical protein
VALLKAALLAARLSGPVGELVRAWEEVKLLPLLPSLRAAAAAAEPLPLPTAARPPVCASLFSALPTCHYTLSESQSSSAVSAADSASTPNTRACHILACCFAFAASPPPPKRQPPA